MKINKKIIVSTLALAMGAALAGSVSGTVAWFQYSTRAQLAYIGSTAHCSENLQMKVKNTWGSEFDSSAFATAAGLTGTNLQPITSGGMEADGEFAASSLKANPVYQHFAIGDWLTAGAANYVQFTLNFRILDVDGEDDPTYLGGNLYLTNLEIVSLDDNNALDNSDLYKAIRVQIATEDNNFLFASDKDSTDTEIETDTFGSLDLNNDGELDKTEGYEWTSGRTVGVYGTADSTQTSYNVAADGVLADDSDLNAIDAGDHGLIGEIEADAENGGLEVTVTIWIEGWQKLEKIEEDNYDDKQSAESSAVWSADDYVGANFGVGMRFATDLHSVNHQ